VRIVTGDIYSTMIVGARSNYALGRDWALLRHLARFASRWSNVAKREARELRARCSTSAKSSHRDERSFGERCDGRWPLFCGLCIVGIVDEEPGQDVRIQGPHGLPRRERVSSEAGSKSSRRRGTLRAGALTISAMPVTSAVATERTTRSFSPYGSSSTSILAPGPIPSRRRNAAGNTIWPFEETRSVDMWVPKPDERISSWLGLRRKEMLGDRPPVLLG
jgi:hypothetical protein